MGSLRPVLGGCLSRRRRTVRRAVAALLLLGACGRAPSSEGAYRAPDGSFTASLPGTWRVDETASGSRLAAFYGPPGGKKPFSQVIAVSREVGDAAAFLARASAGGGGAPRPFAPDAAPLDVSFERALPSTHGGPARENVRLVSVPGQGGFFVLEHGWPLGDAPAPEFEAFLASFKPAER